MTNLAQVLQLARHFTHEAKAHLGGDGADTQTWAGVMSAMGKLRGELDAALFSPDSEESGPMKNPIHALLTRDDFLSWLDALDEAISAAQQMQDPTEGLARVWQLADAIAAGCERFVQSP